MKKPKTKELAQTPNSRSKEKVEHEKAIIVLAETKKLKRTARFAKQGESEFSRELESNKNKSAEIEGLYNVVESANYLEIKPAAFSQRAIKHKLPFQKINKKKYYTSETLDFHKNNTKFLHRK